MADIEIISPLMSESSLSDLYQNNSVNISCNILDILRNSNNIDYLLNYIIYTETNSIFINNICVNIDSSFNNNINILTNDSLINLIKFIGISTTTSKTATISTTSNGKNILPKKYNAITATMKTSHSITVQSYTGYQTIIATIIPSVNMKLIKPIIYMNNSYNSDYFLNIDFINDGEFIDTEIDDYSNLIIKGGNL